VFIAVVYPISTHLFLCILVTGLFSQPLVTGFPMTQDGQTTYGQDKNCKEKDLHSI
jgi:hypothetical protein